jgi:hypothetical protein
MNCFALMAMTVFVMPGFLTAPGGATANKDSSVHIVVAVGKKESIKLKSAHGLIPAEFHEIRLNIRELNGKTNPASLFVVYEPNSKLFWWIYQMGHAFEKPASGRIERFLKQTKFFLADKKIIGVYMSGFYQIIVRESGEKSANVNEALGGVIKTVENTLSKKQFTGLFSGKEIGTVAIIGRPFYDPGSLDARGAPLPDIEDIMWDGSHWTITFLSPNKATNIKEPERKDTATITLDSNFAPLSATINGKSVYPK